MSLKTNIYQRPYPKQRLSKENKSYSCVAYIDEPLKYSIVDSKRLSHVDDRGYGTQESMERYGQLLEKAMQSKMHEEVPSDCEDWRAKQEKRNQSKSFTTPSTTSSKSSSKQYRETPASKEFSLKKIPFGQTPLATNESLQTSPSLLPPEPHLPDDNLNSYTRTQGQKEFDRDSSSSDDDESKNFDLTLHDEEDDLQHDVPLNFILLTSTTNSKKRVSKQQKKIPIAKRLRFTTDHDDGKNEDQQMDLQQILNYIKQVNANVLQLQKQQQQITVILELQEKFLNILRDGVVVQLLKTYGTKENTVKYALKLMDSLFIDKQDLQNVDVKKIDEDPRIKAIYDAIRQKFNYSVMEMAMIWPPVHDSILSKRRNQGKTLQLKAKPDESITTPSTRQATNQNNNEQPGET
ncbi:unnamed protein product [Didymodactylos carnosus]|uniref:Uncharacterized protein n=1 Tax=Didymodactylos carnosus TaxID=1234261 RepID=A0A815ARW6_9BILA|nr:unnamed protein product [Didymodactylos carnosus]CAF4036424.1 unnamed protein product [Didymodactylos carnosus]